MRSFTARYFIVPVLYVVGSCTYSSGASDMSMDDYLEMDLSQLLEMKVTSVAKREQSLQDVAAAVYVISQDDIKNSGVSSIPDAIALAPGVHVAQISASKWSVSARGFTGFTSNKLLVLLDGRSVYSPAFSGTFWDMPYTPMENIDRIEVIRGPGGTIWGTNAVNGVINIITKSSKDTAEGLVRGSVGNATKFDALAQMGSKMAENIYSRAYITGANYDSNTLAMLDSDGGDEWQRIQGGFRLDGNQSQRTTWTVQGDIYKNSGDQLVYPYWSPESPFPSYRPEDVDTSGANVLGRIEQNRKSDHALSLQVYYDNSEKDENPYNVSFDTFDVDFQYRAPFQDIHILTFGGGYRYTKSSSVENYTQSFPDDASYNLWSGFIQDEIHLFRKKVITTIGVKWEHNDFTGHEWQPSARILWKPKDRHSLWLAGSHAVRTPSILENSGRLLTYKDPVYNIPVSLQGQDDFDSETLYSLETGYRWQKNARFSSDIAMFYSEYDDLYSFMPDPNNPTSLNIINSVEGKSYGVEVALAWKPTKKLDIDLTYTYHELEADNTVQNGVIGVTENGTPGHLVGIRTGLKILESMRLNCLLNWQDEITLRNIAESPDNIQIDSFTSFDANMIWQVTSDFEVMLAGQNLLNSSQLEYIAEAITAPTELERSYYLKLTWNF